MTSILDSAYTGAILYTLLLIVSRFNVIAGNILRYIHMLVHGLLHMVFTNEKSAMAPPPPELPFPQGSPMRTIVFIRHGESVWNEVFNRGFGPSFLYRLGRALLIELTLIPSMDSVFFDTPLGPDGYKQLHDLKRFLDAGDDELSPSHARIVNTINGHKVDTSKSALVVSNLRRAVETASVASWNRISQSSEKIRMLSTLQEISRNVDTQSLLNAREFPGYSFTGVERVNGAPFNVKGEIDVLENTGNKLIKGRGSERQLAFCNWAFRHQHEMIVIAGGHSLWFKSFFNNFLPSSSDHVSKTGKLTNCGIVAFNLYKVPGDRHLGMQTNYGVDPASIDVVYGGFVSKGRML